MEVDSDPKRLNGEDAVRIKIAELQHNLQEERDRYDLLQSQSDFANLAARQEIDKYRRECLSLRETVARLNDDCTTVRERELMDRETINDLMQQMECKEREFAVKFVELKTEIRDLDRGRKRARDEADEWKEKCSQLEAQLSKLVHVIALESERKATVLKTPFAVLAEKNVDLEGRASGPYEENFLLNGKENAKGKEDGELETRKLRIADEKFDLVEKDNVKVKEEELFAKSSQDHAGEVDDELPKRAKKSSCEDLMSFPKPSRKNPLLVVIDSDSDDEAKDCNNAGSQLSEKRFRDAGYLSSDTPSRECSVTGANITSVDATDVQTPLRSAKDLEERNRSSGSKKKFRRSDLICSSTARSRGSSRRTSVSNNGAQAYHKRNVNNSTSERAYVGRIPSSEQRKQAEKRAEELRSKLRPSFVKPMALSHVSGSFWLSLPTKFCNEKLPTCTLEMILEDENGVEHGVNYIGHSNALSAGWRGFALNHNLELGDALIFELREPTRFKVYIIKAIPEESCEDSDNMTAKEQIHGTNRLVSLDGNEDQDVDLSDVW